MHRDADSDNVTATELEASDEDIEASEHGRGSAMQQSPRWVAIIGVVIGLVLAVAWLTLRHRSH